ncbi:Dicarboxylic amino acid permease [Psilocybe cubensis]|uniref:Dicarboxylic amino acid permease n=1 Tax=Psilocybe cubensis TaxID=181762 RepID=A0ACB8GUA2_PSICU|nr:Dicarboxylic amino acid permease [Psilocybe cubensis]KAH9479305.1 Dicarboxylic amino acid permease [Psilocybe cubensis]
MEKKEQEKSNRDGRENDSLEDGVVPPPYGAVRQTNKAFHFDEHDLDRVQRRLKQRHVQMIAIAGTIGTGLFLGSGGALATAGPLGALIAYALVGTVAYSSLCAVGEMSTWAPISGTFPHFAARWVDPALGFATGWNYFYTNAISTPSEITAAVILLTFWDHNTDHIPAYTAVLCVLVCLINIFGVRYFGESEFIFALIKLTLIIGLLLVGLVVDLGGGPKGDRIGFRYWKNPGAINRAGLVNSHIGIDRFLAMLSVLVNAAFSFQGMELVVIAASETESPRRNIAKAVRRVFYRILIFYILGILMIGMLVAYNDEDLLSLQGNNTASSSPFVIAIKRAGINVLPHIVNGCIFTSAFSAGNSFLFCSSRVLYGLALRGQAPRILTYCTKKGLPLYAVLVASCFSFLSFMSVSSGSNKVFVWFVNLSTTGGFTSWFVMNITYIYFRRGMLAQGYDLTKNSYHNKWQPYVSYWGAAWTLFFIFVNGFAVFWNFDAAGFLTAYINIPIFVVLYLGYKVWKRTQIWDPMEMDFVTGIPTLEETEEPEIPPKNIGEKIADIIF